jgi:uncharacterized protein YjiS (DUF1127 family)
VQRPQSRRDSPTTSNPLIMNNLTMHHAAKLPPLYSFTFTLRGAWRGARRAWLLARNRQRQARHDRESLRQLYEMNDQILSDIGLSRSDLPWLTRRDAFDRPPDD